MLLLISFATLVSIEPGLLTPQPKRKIDIAPAPNQAKHFLIPFSFIPSPRRGGLLQQVTLSSPLDEASPQTRICTGVAAGALHRDPASRSGARSRHPARLQDVLPARKVTPGGNAEPGTRVFRKIAQRTEKDLAGRLRLPRPPDGRVLPFPPLHPREHEESFQLRRL